VSGLHVFRGEDAALLGTAVQECVHLLVGAGDRSLMVEELDCDEYAVASVVAAAQQPPFLTDRRVVVARGLQRFGADELRGLAAYVADPNPTTDLVLATTGKLPKALLDAVKASGGIITDTDVATRKGDRLQHVKEHAAAAGLRLDAEALAAVTDHLGDDLGRLESILATLVGTFGPGARIGAGDIRPFLGDAGAVPPWEFTDAIDRGDAGAALAQLDRMLGAGARHPLQVMATLHGHLGRMLRLDGAGAGSEKAAAEVLGLKGSTFPAKKALDQLHRLGHEGVAEALALLATADLDLRGARQLGPDAVTSDRTVLEILVARLARLAPSGRDRRPARR
jgi:DNA polymerase III subunit delta